MTDGGKRRRGRGRRGSSTGGGSGGGGVFDAGDGTTTIIIPPGSFNLDGGSNDGGLAENGSGVKVDPNGFMVLNTGSTELSSCGSPTTHRLGQQVRHPHRQRSRPLLVGGAARLFSAAGQPKGLPCTGARDNNLRGNNANHPSRTALDLNGDVWVANRGDLDPRVGDEDRQ